MQTPKRNTEKGERQMRWLTHAKWQEMGYRVIKGVKSSKRDEHGVALFCDHEVTIHRSAGRRYLAGGNSDHGSGDWDSDPGYSDLGIDTFQ
jgi:hypothetical protein